MGKLAEEATLLFNGLSVVDYLLASYCCDLNDLCNFRILEFSEFSDHAPILFSVLSRKYTQKCSPAEASRFELKIIYDESKADIFRLELMNTNEVLYRLTEQVKNNGPIDSIVIHSLISCTLQLRVCTARSFA